MKDCFIDLDIVLGMIEAGRSWPHESRTTARGGRITSGLRNSAPAGAARSRNPARFVLEFAAGTIDAIGLSIGIGWNLTPKPQSVANNPNREGVDRFLPHANPAQWMVIFAEESFQAQAQSGACHLEARRAAKFAQIEWGTIRTPDDLIRGDTVVLFGPQDQLTLTAEQIREQGRSVTLIDTNPDYCPSSSRSAWKHCWNKRTNPPAPQGLRLRNSLPFRMPMNSCRELSRREFSARSLARIPSEIRRLGGMDSGVPAAIWPVTFSREPATDGGLSFCCVMSWDTGLAAIAALLTQSFTMP